MEKFNDTFRVETTRLKEWDYSSPWWYYVTINTKDHVEYFGKVEDEKMLLNEIGKIVDGYWNQIPKHFEMIELDSYVVMPNHVHGIIIINGTQNVETCHGMSLQSKKNEFSKPIKNSLSVIVNQFKGAVKRHCNKSNAEKFEWQRGFYDRIIRNEKELYNIRKYIEQNPLRWDLEKSQPENICEV
ncbi:MAG: transposase [Ignavibacteria bacterium]|nr:transposase [Ignavibacteria bacterium]